MGCNPECYTKGRGCVISKQGRCALLFDEEPKAMVGNFKEAFDALVRDNKPYNNTYPTKRKKIAP